MKIKILSMILLLLLTFGAVACEGGADITLPPESNGTYTPVVQTSYGFIYKNIKITPHDKMSELLPGIGDPVSYEESESCFYQGLDKDYTYPGFKLRTYPMEGVDYVLNVVFTDDSVTTPEGIMLGSSRAEVVAEYGSSFKEENGSTVYTLGKTELRIRFDGDSVSAIEYWALES